MKSIVLPGSKSISNRALLLAALVPFGGGTTVLKNMLWSEDTQAMKDALVAMGVFIEMDGSHVRIKGKGKLEAPSSPLFLKNAGTAVRFLTAVLAHQPFVSQIDGDSRMRERPLADLINALAELGVFIESNEGYLPLTIHGHPIEKNEVHIHGKNSSQYLSGLLMLAPLIPKGLTIHVDGDATSKPYVDLTLDIMNKFCIQGIQNHDYQKITIPEQNYCSIDLAIEPDASSATYFFGWAAIMGQRLKVLDLSRKSLQADVRILEALEQMGCTVLEDEEGIIVAGPNVLKPLGFYDTNAFPDGAMTLAVVAAFASGRTELTGLHNLRIKESDRLKALASELNKLGVRVEEKSDGLVVEGNPEKLKPASIATYNDHRMAMCFGMARARIPGIAIENPECVVKSYPGFWGDFNAL